MRTLWLASVTCTAAAITAGAGIALHHLIQRAVAGNRRARRRGDPTWRTTAGAIGWVLAAALIIAAAAAALFPLAFILLLGSHPRPFGILLIE